MKELLPRWMFWFQELEKSSVVLRGKNGTMFKDRMIANEIPVEEMQWYLDLCVNTAGVLMQDLD